MKIKAIFFRDLYNVVITNTLNKYKNEGIFGGYPGERSRFLFFVFLF
jgi:hypothetical protein